MDAAALERLHAAIVSCRACEERGFIPEAAPVVSPRFGGGRLMLIGQAPGQVEAVEREPFMGRAGRVLFRWMASVGITEEDFRRRVYMTSVTKCFPGKALVAGGGDRRPSPEELRLCRPWLDAQLALVDPTLILLVGKMAIDLYLPGRSLDELVGEPFESDALQLLPLPHPSGMSRWLNAPANREKLTRALAFFRQKWDAHLLSP
ncbi:MAG: uracil-DNA glycosylase family protein [Chloroflexi bacterium]|nr:uracil-DNA glycosylase family protein [Chloroflexota bacterium]